MTACTMRRLRAGSLIAIALSVAILLVGCGRFHQPKAPLAAKDSFEQKKPQKPSAQTLYAMARILAAKGQDGECETLLTRTISEYPNFLPAYELLGRIRVSQSRVNDAVQAFRLGLEQAPNDSVMLNNIGMCYLIRSDYVVAQNYFEQATAAMPSNARYRGNLALSLGLQGREEEARALYSQVLPEREVEQNMNTILARR